MVVCVVFIKSKFSEKQSRGTVEIGEGDGCGMRAIANALPGHTPWSSGVVVAVQTQSYKVRLGNDINHSLMVFVPATQRTRRVTCHQNLVRSRRSEPQMS